MKQKNINIKRMAPLGILIVSLLVTIFVVSKFVGVLAGNKTQPAERVSVVSAKATKNINKEFSFPLKDSAGKKITDLKFIVDTAELRDEIIVKGQRATAVQGRTFLILNIRMTSDFTKGLQINSKDYLRLTLNGNTTDFLAPEIHNDPVVIEPTSTKITRVGWPINDSDKNLILHVGEIGGEKTQIEISF